MSVGLNKQPFERVYFTRRNLFCRNKVEELFQSLFFQSLTCFYLGVGEKIDSLMHHNSLFNDSESILSLSVPPLFLLDNKSDLHLLCAFSKRPRIHVKS